MPQIQRTLSAGTSVTRVMELIRSATHPSEVWALLKFKFGGGKDMVMPKIDQVICR